MQDENRGNCGGCGEGPGCGPMERNCGCGYNGNSGILFFLIIFLLLFNNNGCCGGFGF